MSKIVDMKVFLDILHQFLDYLGDTYPLFKSDIYLTKTSIKLLESTNPRLVVEQFMEYILPYSTQIENCEEEFFLNFDNLVSSDTPQDNVMFAMRIRNIWLAKSTSDTQKAKIWWYFKKLLKSGKRAI